MLVTLAAVPARAQQHVVRDVLGQRVERGEPFFGVLAELVHLRERAHALFDVFHRVVNFCLCSEVSGEMRNGPTCIRSRRFQGAGQRLGWTTWLGSRTSPTDAGDLHLDGETLVDRDRAA